MKLLLLSPKIFNVAPSFGGQKKVSFSALLRAAWTPQKQGGSARFVCGLFELLAATALSLTPASTTGRVLVPSARGEMRIISFIDQPDVIKKILQHLVLWEDSHAPPQKSRKAREITFDPSYPQLTKTSFNSLAEPISLH